MVGNCAACPATKSVRIHVSSHALPAVVAIDVFLQGFFQGAGERERERETGKKRKRKDKPGGGRGEGGRAGIRKQRGGQSGMGGGRCQTLLLLLLLQLMWPFLPGSGTVSGPE